MKNTTLCYIEKDGSYLMLHRNKKKDDENEGKWIGVGGKFLEGESPDDCLLREVREETGLVLTSFKPRGIVTFVSDVFETEYMFLYTADGYIGEIGETGEIGEIGECDEGELHWVKKEDVISLPLWQGDRIFLSLLCDDHPFFSLKLSYKKDDLVDAVLNGEHVDF